ncbi:MAG: hypothetical protein SGJ10_11875 [Bacteroidota bacterium]|nr:hypothetical protein [Bacteroidota bacterium]
MNKYNKNRAPIGDAEIESSKNFESLLNNYNTSPKPKVYNKPMLWSAAASIIAVVGIMAYSYLKTDAPLISTQPFVNPPITGVNLPDTTLQINASTGGTIILPSGSMIEVPANAFANMDGSIVKGMIDLKYREFRKPTDFFVSGIPMTYDSAGTKYTFESAGMFDLTGFVGGAPIKIAEGKSLNVKMSTAFGENKYNKYVLDTVSKTWVYLGKSELVKTEETIDEIKKPKKEIISSKSDIIKVPVDTNTEITFVEAIKAEDSKPILVPSGAFVKPVYKPIAEIKPAKPAKLKDMKNTFKLEVDPGQFPEIAVYKDVLFEIPLAQYNKLPANFEKNDFEDVKMMKSITEGYYDFTLVKANRGGDPSIYSLTNCSPVFTGKDYDAAMETYNTLYAKYESRYTGKVLNQERNQKKLIEDEAKQKEDFAKYEKAMEEFRRKQAEAWEKQNKSSYIQSIGYRAFQVRQFGMYNGDCPSSFPTGATVLASVTDDKGKTIAFTTLYMVDHGRNALYTISNGGDKANLTYNPESSTTFWVVTNDGKIAMIEPAEVKKLKPKKEGINQLTFAMRVSEKDLKTEGDIAEFLNLN